MALDHLAADLKSLVHELGDHGMTIDQIGAFSDSRILQRVIQNL